MTAQSPSSHLMRTSSAFIPRSPFNPQGILGHCRFPLLAAGAIFFFVAALPTTAQTETKPPPRPSVAATPSPEAVRPQPSATNTALSPAPLSAPNNYQLSANDQIAVEVFGEDDLRTSARLNSDGNVSLPLLGSVRLAGLTLNQAATRLTELYGRDYLVHPKVNVTLVGYAKRRFTVLGQVNRPGSYEMPEGSPGGIDLLEAIG